MSSNPPSQQQQQQQQEGEKDPNMMSAAFGMMKNALNDVAHRRTGSIR